MNGTHHIGRERLHRLPIRSAHESLRGEMEHDLGPPPCQCRSHCGPIANVADVRLDLRIQARQREQARLRRWRQRQANDACPHPMQPDAKPRSLETGMADDKDAPPLPEVLARIEQRLHGAHQSLPTCDGRRAVEPGGVKKWLAEPAKSYREERASSDAWSRALCIPRKIASASSCDWCCRHPSSCRTRSASDPDGLIPQAERQANVIRAATRRITGNSLL